MALQFDEHDLSQARRFNAFLAWAPRARVRSRYDLALFRAGVRAAKTVSTLRLRSSGLTVDERIIGGPASAVGIRVLRAPGPCRAVYLDMHGGGWALGDPAMDDGFN